VAVGLIAGLLVGFVAALVRDLTDTRVRTAEDVERAASLSLLASLDTPRSRDAGRNLVVASDPRSPQAEGFRSLRTAVQFMAQRDRALSLLVTSARAEEGKSTVAANLALTMAEAGLRVVLVDADLRRPSVADTFGVEGSAGLTSVLIGQVDLDEVLQEWGPNGLQVLTTGPLPPNPSELLSSPAMADVLARLGTDHDVVIVDSAPLLPVTDASILARATAATLLVVDAQKTRRPVLRQAITLLERADARMAGVVLTHVPQRGPDSYGYVYRQADEERAPRPSSRRVPVSASSSPPRR
jgi:capsular exopolysaccharide synthesis family protein